MDTVERSVAADPRPDAGLGRLDEKEYVARTDSDLEKASSALGNAKGESASFLLQRAFDVALTGLRMSRCRTFVVWGCHCSSRCRPLHDNLQKIPALMHCRTSCTRRITGRTAA